MIKYPYLEGETKEEHKKRVNRIKVARYRARQQADPEKVKIYREKCKLKMRRLRAKWVWDPAKVQKRRDTLAAWKKRNRDKVKAIKEKSKAKNPELYKEIQREGQRRYREKLRALGIKWWLPIAPQKEALCAEQPKIMRIEKIGNKTIHRLLG